MKTETILKAIAALNAGGDMLYIGHPDSVKEQMKIGAECRSIAYDLQKELTADVPELKVEPERVDPLAWSRANGVEEF